ncbi:MAG: DoxX family rane protein [Paenibacillus sp.]|nr:DoxX family rane protein [Paenibacillus sp.]
MDIESEGLILLKKGYALLLLGAVGLLGLSSTAEAHVKWFTEVVPEKEAITAILSPLFMGLALFTALLLAILTQVLPALSAWKLMQRIDHKLDEWRRYSVYILKYGMAVALLIQYFSGSMFVPEFELITTLDTILLWLSIVLLIVPHHIATKAAALVTLWLLISLTSTAGIFHMLDYGFYLGIVAVLLLNQTKVERWGFPILYLSTGLSLCWVAIEKWVFPSMALDIIENHGVPTFGFAPGAFVVMAAFIEFVVGYLLVVGILNRLLSLVLTLIFVSTTMLFGMTELVGHFMIHIILIIFIIEGVSFYKPPVEMHDRRWDQIIFVSLNFLFVLSTFLLIYYRFA